MTDNDRPPKRYSCFINDVDCPDCAAKIEARVKRIRGVKGAHLSAINSRLEVTFDEETAGPEEVKRVVRALGYGIESRARPEALSPRPKDPAFRSRWVLTCLSGLFVLSGIVIQSLWNIEPLSMSLYLAATLLVGLPIFRKGLLSLRNLSLDMNFLMTVAVFGAIAIGQWIEAASVAFLFSLANLLESFATGRARRAIESLMDLSPKTALVRRDGREVDVPVEEVGLEEHLLVKPGERIPLDGSIVSGSSSVDQSAITGESIPVEKGVTDIVFAGTINGRGFLEISVEKRYRDTTLSHILHMVEEAQIRKAPTHLAIDRFSRIYTPLVVAAAVCLAVVPILVIHLPFDVWFYRALVLLVIACPCAFVISTPVTIVSGLTSAARSGILIKGGRSLEEVGRLNTVAFDKTGTITYGRPEVSEIITFDNRMKGDMELLQLAADLEMRSEHPFSEAILRKASQEGIHAREPEEFISLPGRGVRIKRGGETFFAGNHRLFEEMGKCPENLHTDLLKIESSGKSTVFIGSELDLLGAITLEDRVRPGVEQALQQLRKSGVSNLVMLTGDNQDTAEVIARKVGIEDYRAEQLPQDKAETIGRLKMAFGHVAMVGDGVNDAPALATASVGIAMGAAGSDAAMETADISLMADDLSKLPVTIGLGRKALSIIHENVVFSILTKAVFLTLAPFGLVNLWMAVAADMGASLLVIFNGLRLLERSNRERPSLETGGGGGTLPFLA